MARKAKGWTCQRTVKGVRCATHNVPGTRKCAKCLKPRPVRKKPAHMTGLSNYDYAHYLTLSGGIEKCMICGRKPSPNRKLDRDHDHKTGKPRGLLCHQCNRHLKNWVTADWLEAAAKYLRETA